MLILVIIMFQINIPLFNEPRMDLMSKVEPIDQFPILWFDESSDINDVSLKQMTFGPYKQLPRRLYLLLVVPWENFL